MSDADDIHNIKHAIFIQDNPPAGSINQGGRLNGELLTMKNGEKWFHPYTGNRGGPVKIDDTNKHKLHVYPKY